MTSSVYRFPCLKRTQDQWKAISSFLAKRGMQALNSRHAARPLTEIPSVEKVYDLLWALLESKDARNPGKVIRSFDPEASLVGGGQRTMGLSYERAQTATMHAARYIVENWDPFFLEKAAERGRRGGLKGAGKPRPSARVATVEDLETVAGFSIPQQAERLGVSLSTIGRLRKEAREIAERAAANLHLLKGLITGETEDEIQESEALPLVSYLICEIFQDAQSIPLAPALVPLLDPPEEVT